MTFSQNTFLSDTKEWILILQFPLFSFPNTIHDTPPGTSPPFGGAWGGSSFSHLFCFGGAWGGYSSGLGRPFLSLLSFPFWTIFTFHPPYFLFFLPHPSFSLFVTLRFSMSYSWCCKRACFALQKGVFYIAKGHLLPCKRCSFTTRKSVYWKPIMKNLVSNSPFPPSGTYWKTFQPLILTYSSQSETPTSLRRLAVVNLSFLFLRVVILILIYSIQAILWATKFMMFITGGQFLWSFFKYSFWCE